MYSKKNITLMVILSIFIFTGCGDDEKKDTTTSSPSPIPIKQLTKGYLIDSAVSGVTYSCGDIIGQTLSDGEFSCENAPITFSIGSYELGTINTFTEDTKVYPQDLAGVPRTNFTQEDVVKMTQLLQSLDEDKNANNGITITEETKNALKDAEKEMTLEELVALSGGAEVIGKEEAIAHLTQQIETVINSNGGDVNLDEVDLSTYSFIYVYKNTTAQVINDLKTINKDNSDFSFSDEIVVCDDLRGYVNLSTLSNGFEGAFEIPENDFEINVETNFYVALNGTSVCIEVDYANSKSAGANSATIYWNN